MLHPSYTELMEKINKEGETGEEPAVIPSLLQLLREQERLLEEMNL